MRLDDFLPVDRHHRRHGFHGLNTGFFRQSSNCATILLLHNFVPPSAFVESDKTPTLSTCFSPMLSFHSDPTEVFGLSHYRLSRQRTNPAHPETAATSHR